MTLLPRVSVIMPVYNGEKHLHESIKSVLEQTYSNFELIIICEPCIDNSVNIVLSFSDNRIRLITNNQKLGLARSLNKALYSANGSYIARTDCDDIMFANRLEKQVEYLDSHPGITVVGSWWQSIDPSGKIIAFQKLPGKSSECDFWFYLLGEQPVGHPCVMFRREIAVKLGGYNESVTQAEDAEFWFRMAWNGYKFENITVPLIYYRFHTQQLSALYKKTTEESHNNSFAQFISHTLGYSVAPEEAAMIRKIWYSKYQITSDEQIRKTFKLKQEIAEKYFSIHKLTNKNIVLLTVWIFFSMLPLIKLKNIDKISAFKKIEKICRTLLLKKLGAKKVIKTIFILYYYLLIKIKGMKFLTSQKSYNDFLHNYILFDKIHLK